MPEPGEKSLSVADVAALLKELGMSVTSPPSAPPAPAPNPAAPLVALGEIQLMIKAAAADNYDVQGLGLLAFNGAVLAANIAAKGLLEKLWWMSMIGIGVSIFFSIGVLLAGSVDVGKKLSAAKTEYGHLTEAVINAELLDDLIETLTRADNRIKMKSRVVGLAIIALIVAGLLAAASSIVS